jgi:uncharacterized membrane protein
MYLGYINFFMLNLVLINSFENETVNQFISEFRYLLIPLLFVGYIIILIFIGYLDTKLGFRQEEMRNNAMNNPVMRDLLSSIEEIKNDVKATSEKVSNTNASS